MTEHDELEARLTRAFADHLPTAPASLSARLDGRLGAPSRHRAPKFGVLLAPIAAAVVIVGIALLPNSPVPGSSPTAASSSALSPAPAADWIRHEVSTEPGAITELWSLDGAYVGILWSYEANGAKSSLVRSMKGTEWDIIAPPAPGYRPASGAIVAGELHVFGYLGSFETPQWVAYTYSTVQGWREIGSIDGFPGSTNLIATRYAEAGWLAWLAVHRIEPGGGDVTTVELRFSEDGLRWEPLPSFEFDSKTFYTGIESDGRTFVVLRYDDTVEGQTGTVALSSTDGRTWAEHPVPSTNGGPRFVASDGSRFVAVGSDATGSASMPAAWSSTDAMTWERADVRVAGGLASSTLAFVTATPLGFVALDMEHAEPWFSRDGTIWRHVQVHSSQERRLPFSAAILGDTIAVGGAGEEGAPSVWVGRLSELAAAGS
jgi:hypothetical protein